MDLVFKPDGNFDEVYLYVISLFSFFHFESPSDPLLKSQEELMEADLHAIVSPTRPINVRKSLSAPH